MRRPARPTTETQVTPTVARTDVSIMGTTVTALEAGRCAEVNKIRYTPRRSSHGTTLAEVPDMVATIAPASRYVGQNICMVQRRLDRPTLLSARGPRSRHHADEATSIARGHARCTS